MSNIAKEGFIQLGHTGVMPVLERTEVGHVGHVLEAGSRAKNLNTATPHCKYKLYSWGRRSTSEPITFNQVGHPNSCRRRQQTLYEVPRAFCFVSQRHVYDLGANRMRLPQLD